jgi:hypothetical protein
MFYGQLLRIFQIDIPVSPNLNTKKPQSILLAAIRECNVTSVDKHLKIPYYREMGSMEVVDLQTVQCCVGRGCDTRGFWGIIDKSGPLACAEFIGDEPEVRDEN